ncbi:MAG: FolC bifunctional protein [Flavipsychrobacter sp.]|jgi:dihydrofolate synthase/folylpolyglutamate synthase|nr:FolC bifunctional protein [Flavipsychrobacter sp.]
MGDNNTYQHTLDYLYERLPMFSRIGKAALKPDLTNTIKLCAALGEPHAKFRSVHIAGTNGKGSTSHALAAVFQQAGYKTGLYTSPHLVDFRERIRVNGTMVSKEWVVSFVEKNKGLIEEIQPSFFEITVAMAFTAFAEQGVDIAIIETGLGGRLDSTNIITPLLSIITNISYDHKDLLGNTLPEIAAEKAGIIKQGVPCVIGEQDDETGRVFFEYAVHKQSTLHYAQSLWGIVRTGSDAKYQYYKVINNATREMLDLRTDLRGNYQQHNIKTVLTAVELLSHQDFKLSIPGALAALAHVKSTTGLHGRWQWLQENPVVICDVAHNPAGLTEVLNQWQQLQANSKHIVLGFVKDKDVDEALALFPKDATYYFCNAQIERALPAAELKEKAASAGLGGNTYVTVSEAINAAQSAMQENDALLITGSFFIVGEALAMWKYENAETGG